MSAPALRETSICPQRRHRIQIRTDLHVAIIVLLNPTAGTKPSADRPAEIAELFRAAGLPARVVSLGSPEEIAEAVDAARRAASGTDAVVAAGGDGTVSNVASALVGSNTPLGVLPIGTLNHFAKDLGIPLDLAQAVDVIVAGRTVNVDVGEVNGRTFLNNSSIGVYPDIVVEREKLRHQGYGKWTALAVANAKVLRHYRQLVVRIEAGGSTKRARTPFLFVGNNEYQVDGIHLGARARLDGGRLFAYLAPRARARELPKLLGLALLGRARAHQTLECFAAEELRVDTPGRRRLRVAFDGEVTRMSTPLRYRAQPRALKVIAPAR
jgi:diacylglycerol kinase family enzyme